MNYIDFVFNKLSYKYNNYKNTYNMLIGFSYGYKIHNIYYYYYYTLLQ